ncbi:MAG: flavodoxin-dependent (E)-4-hydroxy-3-methylbut-2-enyl-diphosphate synthase [Thermoanaerobaculales bacterium]
MTKREPKTEAVPVGPVQIGGGAPVIVQSMTDTDTADAATTARQCRELAEAGSEIVRITINTPRAAAAVPEIRSRLDGVGCSAPLVGDLHFNGHILLREHPQCAKILAKYRINPGTVGGKSRKDDHFATICEIARDHGKAVRIGVNGGSLDPTLVTERMENNTRRSLGLSADEVLNECMVLSALRSADAAHETGLGPDRIVLSCKVSKPRNLIAIYRDLASRTRQPLHLGLTEAGMGVKGMVWSASAMAVLLAEGIGDTIRVSLTPHPGGDRRDEVRAACELLQALGLRSFCPAVTSCPGCGRTTSTTFRELAQRVEEHIRRALPGWRRRFVGVEDLTLAVMGCVVNGPGESKAANVGISLPGTAEEPRCPVFIDGRRITTLGGTPEEVGDLFIAIIDDYVATKYQERES